MTRDALSEEGGRMNWRILLGMVCKNPDEVKRIAHALNRHPESIRRWVKGETTPEVQTLFELRDAMPEELRPQFAQLLEQEPSVQQYSEQARESVRSYIPGSICERILDAWRQTDLRRFWDVGSVILQHAIQQCDPGALGMSISIVRCIPPTKGEVRSLREAIGIGTSPCST